MFLFCKCPNSGAYSASSEEDPAAVFPWPEEPTLGAELVEGYQEDIAAGPLLNAPCIAGFALNDPGMLEPAPNDPDNAGLIFKEPDIVGFMLNAPDIALFVPNDPDTVALAPADPMEFIPEGLPRFIEGPKTEELVWEGLVCWGAVELVWEGLVCWGAVELV